jgi:ADP-ribosylglycohydrolase
VNTLDKFYGCLAGLALGDALGMPTEFLTAAQIQAEYGRVKKLVKAPDWHPHAELRAGQVTDDTGQAIAIAHAYAEDGTITPESVARELMAWEAGTDEKILKVVSGPTTRQALAEIRSGADPSLSGRFGKTNGAAMRMAAVGLLNAGDAEGAIREAIIASTPTHWTQPALAGSAAVACAVAEAAREGADLISILDAAKLGAVQGSREGAWSWTTPLVSRIELAEKLIREARSDGDALRDLSEYVGVDMQVSESVASAIGLVKLAKGEPLRAVMMAANMGGDTDTIAAIAGQICGAWKGAGSMDKAMIEQVEKISHISLMKECLRLESIFKVKKRI